MLAVSVRDCPRRAGLSYSLALDDGQDLAVNDAPELVVFEIFLWQGTSIDLTGKIRPFLPPEVRPRNFCFPLRIMH